MVSKDIKPIRAKRIGASRKERAKDPHNQLMWISDHFGVMAWLMIN
jgi:hypothetical protein